MRWKFLCQIGSVINYTRPLEKNTNKKGKLDTHGWIFFPCSQHTTQSSSSERENLINFDVNDQQFPQISSLLWQMLTGSLLISPSPSENSSRWCWLGGAAIWDLLRSHQGIPRCDFFFSGRTTQKSTARGTNKIHSANFVRLPPTASSE